jgi:predicted Rossmann fold nucleotide-binding protein DprA/Smf involved in DNA uptake
MLFSGDEDPSSEGGVQPVSAADLDGNDARRQADTTALPGPSADFDTRLLALLDEPRTADDLTEQLGTDIASVRVRLTLLELGGRIIRSGNRFARR